MNQKKKAELQRKLSMSAVPTPPADLARRIKAGIPDPLITMKSERDRLSNSIAFSMRVAASIVLLLTSVVLAFHLVSRGDGPLSEEKAAVESAPFDAQSPAASDNTSVVPQFADTATITVDVAPEADARAESLAKKEAPPSLQAKLDNDSSTILRRSRRDAPRQVARIGAAQGSKPAATSGFVVGGVVTAEESRDAAMARQVAAPAAPPPPPVAVAQSTEAADSVREQISVTANAPVVAAPAPPQAAAVAVAPTEIQQRNVAKASRAADFVLDVPRTVFGLSVDPGEFSRIKSIIESGKKPAEKIDVEALVNHFAGTAPVGKPVRLQVEGSRLPIERNESLVMLRFTVDTAAADRRSAAPVGTNAEIEVILNRNALLRHRVIGDTGELEATEGVLRRGLSVTGLVELHIKPGISPRQEIATVRLTYRSAADGRTKNEVISVTARDLDKNWTAASRRHRLATLGAVWGESLRVETPAEDVAKAAEGLAEESPGDARARDLAAAATASSRLRSSAPTGSGR